MRKLCRARGEHWQGPVIVECERAVYGKTDFCKSHQSYGDNETVSAHSWELLEALEGIMASPMSTKAMRAAHAAIAKARGRY